MRSIRQPAVAGMFYPADEHQLHAMIQGILRDANTTGRVLKAIIAPHAGYIYSGPITSAHALLNRTGMSLVA